MVGLFAEAGEKNFQFERLAVFKQAEIGKLNGFGILGAAVVNYRQCAFL